VALDVHSFEITILNKEERDIEAYIVNEPDRRLKPKTNLLEAAGTEECIASLWLGV